MKALQYLPGIAIYSPILYKLSIGDITPQLWMLVLIPFYFLINFVAWIIILRLFLVGHMIYSDIKEEKIGFTIWAAIAIISIAVYIFTA